MRAALRRRRLLPARGQTVRVRVDAGVGRLLHGVNGGHGVDVSHRHVTLPVPGATNHLHRDVLLDVLARVSSRRRSRAACRRLHCHAIWRAVPHPARRAEHVVHRHLPAALLLRHGRRHLVGRARRHVVPGGGEEVESRGDYVTRQLLPPGGVGGSSGQDDRRTGHAASGRGRTDRFVLRRQPRPGGAGWLRARPLIRLPAHRHHLHRRRIRRHVPDTSRPARRRTRHSEVGEADGEDRRLLRALHGAGDVCARLHRIRAAARTPVERGGARVALSRDAGRRRRRRCVRAARAIGARGRGVHAARLHVARRRRHERHVDLVVEDTRVVALVLRALALPASSAAQGDGADVVPAAAAADGAR